jgi:hypothetical protein
MYENGKMDLLKLLQEWGEGGIKENDGQGELNKKLLIQAMRALD